MSGLTHPQTPIKQMLLRDQRRAKIVALAAVTAFTALLVSLILVLEGGNSPTADTDGPAVQSTQQPSAQPGVRYDGGPEEGTAALTRRSAPARFDPASIRRLASAYPRRGELSAAGRNAARLRSRTY
jgi:hypothetical protein